ncbi:MAG: thioredoxin-like domain-containing protein [bacterium]
MRTLFIVLSFLFVQNISFGQQIIKGKLLGYDGKPMKLAKIYYYQGFDRKSLTVSPDGSFEINTNQMFFTNLFFSGVNHQSFSYNILSNQDLASIEITVTLQPNTIPKNYSEVCILGSFNKYKFDSTSITMTKVDDNTYSANISIDKDTLLYQVFFRDTVEGNRSINGTQSDFYVYNGGGDYRSGLIVNKKPVDVVLDLIKFPKGKFERKVEFKNKSLEFLHEVFIRNSRIRSRYTGERSELSDRQKDYEKYKVEIAPIKKKYLEEMKTIYHQENDTKAKILDLIIYFSIASDGGSIGKAKEFVDKKLAEDLFNLAAPTSGYWASGYYTILVPTSVILTDSADSWYIQEVINNHPSEYAKGWTTLSILRYADDVKDSVLLYKYYDFLVDNFPNSQPAESAKIDYNRNKKIVVGNDLPDFRLVNMDNPSDIITKAKLQGNYVLIEFWGMWCSWCFKEMPYLDKAYKKYKDKGFEILSISLDNDISEPKTFRKNKREMPWLNANDEAGFKSEIARTMEVSYVPKAILINPEGKIINLDKIRQDDLLNTLAEIFDK